MKTEPKCRALRSTSCRRRAAAAVVAVLAALGCKEDSKRASGPTESAALPVEPAPPEAAAASFQEEGFKLEMRPSGEYAAGSPGTVAIVLEAKDPYKCNDKYPYKFKAEEAPGIKYREPVVTSDALKLEEKRAVMNVAFTPEASGKQTVAGQFAFSVCTEERCLVERRKLALAIDVE